MLQQLDVGLRRDVFEQVGAAAHDQPRRQAAFGAGPDRQPLLDQLLRQRVERGLGLVLERADLRLGLGQRAAVDVGVEEVRGFLQLRRRGAGRQLDDAVLDVAVLRDQHGQRLGRLELDELDVLERHLVLGRETRPAPRDMPDSIWLASVSMCSSEAPLPDALHLRLDRRGAPRRTGRRAP